jgi:ectoine hydroxylase-related dioxygenase (phytanoyl-CoA dioxygenase family)
MHPAVLNAVESVLGPNIMIWGAEYFIKEAHADSIVSMHQDLTYWGFGETSDQVTAWIALSPSTLESGCMNLVRGSHKNPILEHTDTHAENNLLSRGQEVNVEVEEKDKTPVVLQPGEMSLHHGLTIHGSGPNVSDDRRIGFAIRYINPKARQLAVTREYALMARGVDTTQSFIHYAPPASTFSSTNLAIYEQIRDAQNKVLGAGMEAGRDLYESSA